MMTTSVAARAFGALVTVNLLTMAAATRLNSCTAQKKCLEWTVTPTGEPNECDADHADCAYTVCMTLDFSKPGCGKGPTDTVSHTCDQPNGCGSDFTSFGGATEVQNISTGYTECQADSYLGDGCIKSCKANYWQLKLKWHECCKRGIC